MSTPGDREKAIRSQILFLHTFFFLPLIHKMVSCCCLFEQNVYMAQNCQIRHYILKMMAMIRKSHIFIISAKTNSLSFEYFRCLCVLLIEIPFQNILPIRKFGIFQRINRSLTVEPLTRAHKPNFNSFFFWSRFESFNPYLFPLKLQFNIFLFRRLYPCN